MTTEKPLHDDELDKELLQLFDATAEEASGPTLTKLSARAADIPSQVKRRPRWRSLLFWAPGMAAAVAALVLVLSPSLKHVRPATVASSGTSHPALSVPIAHQAATAPATPAAPAPAADDPDTADLVAGFDDSDPQATADISLDPLYGPQQGDDLDAWLYATDSVLQNGG